MAWVKGQACAMEALQLLRSEPFPPLIPDHKHRFVLVCFFLVQFLLTFIPIYRSDDSVSDWEPFEKI